MLTHADRCRRIYTLPSGKLRPGLVWAAYSLALARCNEQDAHERATR